MYKGYIIHKDRALLVEDSGKITEVDNVDNLKDILVLENTLDYYNEEYVDYACVKDELKNRRINRKSNAIAGFTIGAASPLMSYGIGKLISINDISDITIPLGCMVGTVMIGFGLGELKLRPKKKKIDNLEFNMKNINLVTNSIEDVIRLEKEKSKKISGEYKVIDNLDEDTYDNFVEYYINNKDNLLEEYNRKDIITDNCNDQLYNKVLTKMIMRDRKANLS